MFSRFQTTLWKGSKSLSDERQGSDLSRVLHRKQYICPKFSQVAKWHQLSELPRNYKSIPNSHSVVLQCFQTQTVVLVLWGQGLAGYNVSMILY